MNIGKRKNEKVLIKRMKETAKFSEKDLEFDSDKNYFELQKKRWKKLKE